MNVEEFLQQLKRDPAYADQIVHVHERPAAQAEYAPADHAVYDRLAGLPESIGISKLYQHQAEAVAASLAGEDVLLCTGTASGKSLGYVLPILHALRQDPDARALLLFPSKALCQDQFQSFNRKLSSAGLDQRLCGVFDGDTPSELRRKLRDHGAAIFSNPDMLHASLMPQHARWAEFLRNLQYIVLDELHVYSGIFGTNMALLLHRLFRLCAHYGSRPRIVACSATIANPRELAMELTGRPFRVIDTDSSPRGRRFAIFWNPPRIRQTTWRSRRSANVEAHELMARLVAQGTPTITFSKAKMTAEMIYRYVCERLSELAPQQVSRVTPYRGGYRPTERREIEKRLFDGELLGVSTTRALELGIDVGVLEAAIVVGYPGTRASFFQQAGRAGRKEADAVVFLVGLDTAVNQYIMSHPDYLFERCVESAVIDPANPFVVTGHLRCATHELALPDSDIGSFGPFADVALEVLEENRKVKLIDGLWYHASSDVPQHEISLRDTTGANVLIQDVDSGEVLGEVDRFDAPPILHPHAVYMHLGDTYLVRELDLERNIAYVQRQEVDYYTQPLGGMDIHHIDHQLREKPFGRGRICWGEATAYCGLHAFEKVHFYSLDTISVHGVDLPTMVLETMAFWLIPDESIMEQVRNAGLDAHSGLRGIGYATRMLLPLFMTCDTLDFSHTVGSVNSPWNAVFIFERYPHGLGFTEKAYHRAHEIMPAVLQAIEQCSCEQGCPCCVGKPLRQYATWNVERGEASIPSKEAALMILREQLGGGKLQATETFALSESDPADRERLRQALRRRLERMREPEVFHAIRPQPEIRTEYPDRERDEGLEEADVTRRAERRRDFDRDLHKRLAAKIGLDGLNPLAGRKPLPPGMRTRRGNLRPTDFPGRPVKEKETTEPPSSSPPSGALKAGDSVAARARRRVKKRR